MGSHLSCLGVVLKFRIKPMCFFFTSSFNKLPERFFSSSPQSVSGPFHVWCSFRQSKPVDSTGKGPEVGEKFGAEPELIARGSQMTRKTSTAERGVNIVSRL